MVMEHFAHKESPLPTPYNPVTLSCTESRLIYYCTPNARSGAPKLQSWVEDVEGQGAIRFDFRRLPSPATPQLHLSCLNHLEEPKTSQFRKIHSQAASFCAFRHAPESAGGDPKETEPKRPYPGPCPLHRNRPQAFGVRGNGRAANPNRNEPPPPPSCTSSSSSSSSYSSSSSSSS